MITFGGSILTFVLISSTKIASVILGKPPQKLWNGVEPPPIRKIVRSFVTFFVLMASLRQQSRPNQPGGFEKIRVKVTQAEVEAGRRVPAAGQSRPSQEKSAEREVAAGLTTDLALV